jgi:TonB family protein
MTEAVTDIIVSRARQPEGLLKMVVWSVAVHVAVVGALVLMPERSSEEAPRTVMTISLGGAPGPRTGGITQAGGRAIQAPSTEKPPTVAPPPAPARPAMTIPEPKARVRPERPRAQNAPPESNARTLSTGEQPRQGSTRTETQVRGQGFGLSSSGGGGGPITVDAPDFCCREYLEQMRDIIQRNWEANQGVVGVTQMKFTIQRNGRLVQIEVERPSGFTALDLASQRALLRTQQVLPLPAQYLNPELTVHMRFEYQR